MKKLFVFLVLLLLFNCKTTPTPIIIYKIPKHDVSSDITIEEYLKESTSYVIKLRAYIDELINQIVNKVPYIDLRKEKNNADNTNK